VKNIEILYEDEYSLIINKPAGLAVQGGEGVKTSLDRLLEDYSQTKGGTEKPLLVHRLDKDTSGVLLAAKGREAAARFSKIFGADRKAVKLYTAVCACNERNTLLQEKEGIIKDELLIRGNLKKSETKYKVIKTGILEPDFKYAVLELELGTGRMHQIRRHLAMNGNPILGDDKYGDFTLNKKLRKAAELKRLLPHASRLIIRESYNIDIKAPLPKYFHKYIQLV